MILQNTMKKTNTFLAFLFLTGFINAQDNGINQVVNPDFSQGNSGFSSFYSFCPTSLCESGSYTFYPSVPVLNSSVTAVAKVNYYLVINGSDVPNKAVWSQNISVIPGSQYIFSCKVSSVYSLNSPQLQFSINGILTGSVFSSPKGTGTWNNFTTVWDSKKSPTAVIAIVNQNTNNGSFGLDDISFSKIEVKAVVANNNNGTSSNNNGIKNNTINIGALSNNNATSVVDKTMESSSNAIVPKEGIATFKSILFEYDEPTFNEQGILELDKLVEYLQQHSDYRAKITGHTDSRGTDQYNIALSHKRALSVLTYLTGKGISKKKVMIEYKGEAQPIVPNENPDKSDNPEGRRLNRRADIVIIIDRKI